MGKEHFDLLAQTSRGLEGFRLLQGNNLLADGFIEKHGQGAFWTVRALRADRTRFAVTGGGPIHMYVFFLTRGPMLQELALRTDKDIACGIEGEGLAREQATGLLLPIQHRNMRCNGAR